MSTETLADRKAEVLKMLTEAGDLHRKDKTPAWKAAFEFYWAETGDHNLKMGCGSCYEHLLKWLKR